MFIPPNMVIIGIDPSPYEETKSVHLDRLSLFESGKAAALWASNRARLT